jgi:hypothetical protein
MAELYWVKAGAKLAPGQVAVLEDHPDHPWNETVGAHQAKIVKDDPEADSGQVAMTPRVAEAMQHKFLVETKAPKGAAKAEKSDDEKPDTDDGATTSDEAEQPARRGPGRPAARPE